LHPRKGPVTMTADPTPHPTPESSRVYEARFDFEYGSGAVLWPDNVEDRDTWGYPVDETKLPITEELRSELQRLATWYDDSLNWRYPPDPGLWRHEEC